MGSGCPVAGNCDGREVRRYTFRIQFAVALTAGQNQIVSLNKGARDGMERGHVLVDGGVGGDFVAFDAR